MATKRRRMFDFNDDNRIGYGGFEAPNGRQWWEPENWYKSQMPSVIPPGERIGYFLTNPVTKEIRFIRDGMLSDFTDTDDQDWHDFLIINKS